MAAVAKPTDRQLPASDSLFPETPRIVYERAPLLQVVAALRFPRILRIETDAPADFQDRIRDTFPLLERGPAPVMLPSWPQAQAPQIPAELVRLLTAGAAAVSYRFLTEDRRITLSLTPNSINLTASVYSHWDDFKKLFKIPFGALVNIYRPAFFMRVGLRYINAINRSDLQLQDIPWSRLLRSEILGELSYPEFEETFEMTRRVLRLKTSDMNIMMQHGTATVGNAPSVFLGNVNVPVGSSKQVYAIDCDFSSVSPKTVIADAQSYLDLFNDRAFRAFRWCITDILHNALRPKRVE